MKIGFVVAGLGLAVSANCVLAQGLSAPPCPGGTGLSDPNRVAQDACVQAYDVYQFIAPQLGLALAGGNATLGQGSTLGGLGHFSVGVRANAFSGMLPQVDQFTQSTTGARQSTLPTKTQVLGLPTADAAVGIFGGFPLAVTNILGIDALVSAAYIPTVSSGGASITPRNNWQFGYGARVGLLSESIVVPGVAVTWIERDLPTTDIIATSGGNSLQVLDAKLKTSAWRIVASKSLIIFGVAAGVGRDTYDQAATIKATVSQLGVPLTASIASAQTLTRTNAFLDVSLNLALFKLVAEVGQASGGTVDTYNSFSGGRADRSQVYGSAGLRLGW